MPLQSIMLQIHSVQPNKPEVEVARALFAQYRDFLESAASTHCFKLPAVPGRDRHAVSALHQSERRAPHRASGRTTPLPASPTVKPPENRPQRARSSGSSCCQPFAAQSLARTLIAEALSRAAARGFTRAILDTDIVSMAAAHTLYIALGFTHYTPPGSHPPSLRFLERALSA